MGSRRITLASLRQATSRRRPEVEALHNGIAGKALLLSIAWTIAGAQIADWSWWRALLTSFVACLLTVLVVGGGSGIIDDQHWPTTASARLRSSSAFLTWSGVLLLCAWWMGPGLSLVLASAVLVLLWLLWIWPAAKPPKTKPNTAQLAVPPRVEERARALPQNLPEEIEADIDSALEDWQHLVEVLASDPKLEAQVEPLALRQTAQTTLVSLLDAAGHAAELARIASERPDDAHAPAAAERAHQRLQVLMNGLHDTTSTLLRYVASRDQDQESALRVHIEELEALADVEEALSPQHMEARR